MMFHFNVTGKDRKKLVEAISNHLGIASEYMKAPTFAYQIGSYNVSKDGCVSRNDLDDADPAHLDESTGLIRALEEAGFHSDESDLFHGQEEAVKDEPDQSIGSNSSFTVKIPKDSFSEAALTNLSNLISSKGSLIKKAIASDRIEVEISNDTVSFPWFHRELTDEEVQTYTLFISKLCEYARTSKRSSAKEKTPENEKYSFRCFLLRLGFIGDEYKPHRKILLKNLSGSSAFRLKKC